MIKHYWNWLVIASCAYIVFSLVSCRDDDDSSVVPFPEQTDDEFSGPYYQFLLSQETEGLNFQNIRLLIQSEDGKEFERYATHTRDGSLSRFNLSSGLKEGTYRLLAITNIESSDSDEEWEFGLGSRISVTSERITAIDHFDPILGLAGSGTKEDPFIVSSPTHLFNLMMIVNDYDSNQLISSATYFSQVRNLDMKTVSRNCDLEYGWIPIGADTNTPFRGVYLGNGHTISNLMIKRPNSAGIGLFGYVIDTMIDGVTMKNCTITGQFGVGTVTGALVTSGENNRGQATFSNCKVIDCKLECPVTAASVGGVLGATDMHARSLIADCSVENSRLSGGMNVGGVTGGAGMYSSVMVTNAVNRNTPVTAYYSGAGGIVGTADTLQVVASRNYSNIEGGLYAGKDYPGIGTGGIAGGSGLSWFTACENIGKIKGSEGVGGIVGSTRVRGSESQSFLYNQALLRHCSNTADVSGYRMVGGLIGEAQAGAEGSFNKGSVSGTDDYIGGICGNSSVGVLHNTVNSGAVAGKGYIGGIIGKTTWGSIANNQNLGTVHASNGRAGGILALGGNNTMIHYCSNFGVVTGDSKSPVGGIVGEIGDPRKWTALNIVECVIGSMEIVMAAAGPILAFVEETVEMAEAVEVVIKIVESGIEFSLLSTDYSLFSYGLCEMISPETEEELSASMKATAQEVYGDIDRQLSDLRAGITGDTPQFPAAGWGRYIDNVNELALACSNEEVNEEFNEAINEARAERAEALEKVAKAQEITHTVLAGVAIAGSTVALIGGTVASGGAATAFLVVGTVSAVVGGVNALVKTCTEFEHNAVVISQCVNAAAVTAPSGSAVSSIAGKICDGVMITDCLSTAKTSEHTYGFFIGDDANHNDISHCVSAVNRNMCSIANYFGDCLVVVDGNDEYIDTMLGVTYVSSSRLSSVETYESLGYNIGDGKAWHLPEESPFAIPGKSCYLK